MRTSSNMLLAAAATVLPAAFATIDNSEQYDDLTSRAINLQDGNYTLTNVATGQRLHYVRDGRQLYPDDGYASALTFAGTGDGPYTSFNIDGKCLSAQWDYDAVADGVGADAAAVLYDCAVGENAEASSSVNPDKQKWLLVRGQAKRSRFAAHRLRARATDQCGASSSDSSSDSSSSTETTTYYNTACCEKTKGWIMRHPQYVKGPNYYHMECASLLSKEQRRTMGFTQKDWDYLAELKAKCQASLPDDSPAKISKRDQSSDGIFYIIALDHLDDMPTRALAGSAYEDYSDGKLATSLDAFSEGTEDQQWRIEIA